jgi:hypothetical protein
MTTKFHLKRFVQHPVIKTKLRFFDDKTVCGLIQHNDFKPSNGQRLADSYDLKRFDHLISVCPEEMCINCYKALQAFKESLK